MTEQNQLTGKDSLTFQYYTEKADKLKSKIPGIDAKVIQYAFDVMEGLSKTRLEAIEYVKVRASMSHDERGKHSIEFLRRVNYFLSSFSDREIANIFKNPKHKIALKYRVADIVERAITEQKPEHLQGYVEGIMAIFKGWLKDKSKNLF